MEGMKATSTPASGSEQGEQAVRFYDGSNYSGEESVGYWIKQAYLALQRNLDNEMQGCDLTGMQWGPLWLISRGKADTVAACAREAGIDAGAMTRMLDRLEAKGLLERSRSTQDRRVVHVSLTQRGQEIADRIPYCLAEVMNQHLRGFHRDEPDTLLGLLRRFVSNGGACGDATAPSDEPQS